MLLMQTKHNFDMSLNTPYTTHFLITRKLVLKSTLQSSAPTGSISFTILSFVPSFLLGVRPGLGAGAGIVAKGT